MLAKYIHVSCVIATLGFFFIRGIWMMTDAQVLKQRWVRITAPVIDAILLVSAIIQAINISQYPFVNDWLTAKVLALILYIWLGMIALHRGRTRKARTIAWLAALVCFAYIVSVALTRDPALQLF